MSSSQDDGPRFVILQTVEMFGLINCACVDPMCHCVAHSLFARQNLAIAPKFSVSISLSFMMQLGHAGSEKPTLQLLRLLRFLLQRCSPNGWKSMATEAVLHPPTNQPRHLVRLLSSCPLAAEAEAEAEAGAEAEAEAEDGAVAAVGGVGGGEVEVPLVVAQTSREQRGAKTPRPLPCRTVAGVAPPRSEPQLKLCVRKNARSLS